MSQQHQAQLQEAYQLIKSGNKQDATRMLLAVLKENRDSAEAWWLLANATSDPEKQRQALNQVLRVKPDHNAAQRMLDKVNTSAPPPSAADPFTSPRASAPSDDPFSRPTVSQDDPFGRPRTTSASTDPFASPRSSTPQDDLYGDPFASPRASAPQDDLYGDPFASPRTSAPQDDLYGDPFASPPPSRPVNDDPFGDPFASPPGRKRKDDDPYTQARTRPISDDPFMSGQPIPPPERTRVVVEKKRTNPLVIILAIIGIVVVIGCGLTIIAGIAGFGIVSQAVQTALPEGTFQAAVEEFQNALTEMPSGTLQAALLAAQTAMPGLEDENGIIGNIVEKGAIGFSTPVRANLEADGFTNHAYKFTGESGQNVTIELTAITADFDVKLALLGPDGTLVAENDDIDFQANNLNSRIEISLPANGAYTVVVGDVGFGGGDYELTLE